MMEDLPKYNVSSLMMIIGLLFTLRVSLALTCRPPDLIRQQQIRNENKTKMHATPSLMTGRQKRMHGMYIVIPGLDFNATELILMLRQTTTQMIMNS